VNTSATAIQRARPLLGTFVEIRVRGLAPTKAHAAIDAAFAAIARVHASMSPHEGTSDVARINRARAGETLRVDAWTWRVLDATRWLSRASDGVFDVVAACSMARGSRVGLPLVGRPSRLSRALRDGPAASDGPTKNKLSRRERRQNPFATWRDLELLPCNRVRIARPLRIDLGGIAKGFAVDRAIDVLRVNGAPAAVVNAGGDLRVFGPAAERVHVRHPAAPFTLVAIAEVLDEALATSANYLDAHGAPRLVRPDGRRLWLGRGSVSVRAPSCLFADALSKVVAAVGLRAAAPLLATCDASALVLTRSGRVLTSERIAEVRRAA
jgi:thiamine biosynthesis lipoprotein